MKADYSSIIYCAPCQKHSQSCKHWWAIFKGLNKGAEQDKSAY